MKKIIALLLLASLVALAFCSCGDNSENNDTPYRAQNMVTITAQVTEVNGTLLTVRGLTEGYGSYYTLNIFHTGVYREGEEHRSFTPEIKIGDTLSITFGGVSTKDNPGTLQNVLKVVILNG